jgi:hypothetical protein
MIRPLSLLLFASLCLCVYGVNDPSGANELVATVASNFGHALRAWIG